MSIREYISSIQNEELISDTSEFQNRLARLNQIVNSNSQFSKDIIETEREISNKVFSLIGILSLFSKIESEKKREEKYTNELIKFLFESKAFYSEILNLLSMDKANDKRIYGDIFENSDLQAKIDKNIMCTELINSISKFSEKELRNIIENCDRINLDYIFSKNKWKIIEFDELYIRLCLSNKITISLFNLINNFNQPVETFSYNDITENVLENIEWQDKFEDRKGTIHDVAQGIFILMYNHDYKETDELILHLLQYSKYSIKEYKRKLSGNINYYTFLENEDTISEEVVYYNLESKKFYDYIPEEICFKCGISDNFVIPYEKNDISRWYCLKYDRNKDDIDNEEELADKLYDNLYKYFDDRDLNDKEIPINETKKKIEEHKMYVKEIINEEKNRRELNNTKYTNPNIIRISSHFMKKNLFNHVLPAGITFQN